MEVSAQVHITKNAVHLNGTPVLSAEDILRAAYEDVDLDHSKFFKMDTLSKLGILSVEYIVCNNDLSVYTDDRVALCFNNRDSSLDTDHEHQQWMEKGSPSPAVFVYTLPNIVLGEISIKHKWYGEQICTVTEKFNAELIHSMICSLFNMNKADAVILMNINCLGNNFDAKTALIERNNTGSVEDLSIQALSEIFN